MFWQRYNPAFTIQPQRLPVAWVEKEMLVTTSEVRHRYHLLLFFENNTRPSVASLFLFFKVLYELDSLFFF